MRVHRHTFLGRGEAETIITVRDGDNIKINTINANDFEQIEIILNHRRLASLRDRFTELLREYETAQSPGTRTGRNEGAPPSPPQRHYYGQNATISGTQHSGRVDWGTSPPQAVPSSYIGTPLEVRTAPNRYTLPSDTDLAEMAAMETAEDHDF